jgi:hypothetical protein
MNWDNLDLLAAIKPLHDSIPWQPISRHHPEKAPDQFFPDMSAFAEIVERLPTADRASYNRAQMIVPGWYVVDKATETAQWLTRDHHYAYVTVTWIDHAWTVRVFETGDLTTF